jgi:hypothetical protein
MRAKEGAAFRDRSYVRHIGLHPLNPSPDRSGRTQPKIGEDEDAKAPQPVGQRGKLGARTILLATLYITACFSAGLADSRAMLHCWGRQASTLCQAVRRYRVT